jgi:maltose O-acetyltransferase
MSDITDVLRRARQRLDRDSDKPARYVFDKAWDYGWGLVTAPWYLRHATQIGRGVRTTEKPRIRNYGTLVIGDFTVIRSVNTPTEMAIGPGAELRIGRNCSVNYGVSFGVTKSIVIKDRVRVGPYSNLIDSNFHEVYSRNQDPDAYPIRIDSDVWIGSRCLILPGVHIGRGAVIGGGSTVVRDVPPFTIVGGNPAKPTARLDPAGLFCPDEPVRPEDWPPALPDLPIVKTLGPM